MNATRVPPGLAGLYPPAATVRALSGGGGGRQPGLRLRAEQMPVQVVQPALRPSTALVHRGIGAARRALRCSRRWPRGPPDSAVPPCRTAGPSPRSVHGSRFPPCRTAGPSPRSVHGSRFLPPRSVRGSCFPPCRSVPSTAGPSPRSVRGSALSAMSKRSRFSLSAISKRSRFSFSGCVEAFVHCVEAVVPAPRRTARRPSTSTVECRCIPAPSTSRSLTRTADRCG